MGQMDRKRRTWSLEIATERVPGGIVIIPRGRIGTVTAPAFAAALTAARAESARVVIDLDGVDYISGSGLMALSNAAAGEGAHAILCGLREPVRITLELAGLLEGVSVEDSRATAIDTLNPERAL
jgi:anti-anti-sigma factor